MWLQNGGTDVFIGVFIGCCFEAGSEGETLCSPDEGSAAGKSQMVHNLGYIGPVVPVTAVGATSGKQW